MIYTKQQVKFVAFSVYIACCVILGILIARILPNICMNKKCIQKARLIQDSMSEMNPCDNFYQFVCGNYMGFGEDVPEHSSVWEELKEEQVRRLATFLGQPDVRGEDRVLRVLKMVYKSCVDTEEIDSEGVRPLIDNIRLAGGFPLVDTRWDRRNPHWLLNEAEFYIRYTGFRGGLIFQSYVDYIQLDHKKAFVHLTPPENLEFDESHVDHYFAYVKRISSLINKTFEFTEAVGKEVNETINLKRQLSAVLRKIENCSSTLQHEDLTEFDKTYPALGMSKYLSDMLPFVDLPKEVVITYTSKEYFDGVKDILSKAPARIVANYMIIESIMETSPMLTTAFRQAHNEYLKGIKREKYRGEHNREIECVKILKSQVPSALSALFLRDVFHTYKQPVFLERTILALKLELSKIIRGLSWMDSATKEKAVEKVNALGYAAPVAKDAFENLTNHTLFRIHYEDLCFTGNTSDILTAFLAVHRFASGKNWELLGRDEDVFDEHVDIFSAEVVYDSKRNMVVIPMGFLKYPAFDQLWPNYLNYGGFCSKIAMEMVRAIDFSGSEIDLSGNTKNWWGVESKAEYKKYTRCFINKYNLFLEPKAKKKLTDPSCILDDIASSAGLTVAYKAYDKFYEQRFFPERVLPGLPKYSPKQMFFIDFATFYCDSNPRGFNNKTTELELSHIPNEFLVNSALRNSRDFPEKFDCVANDTMNPSGKCDLWKTS